MGKGPLLFLAPRVSVGSGRVKEWTLRSFKLSSREAVPF